VRAAALTAVCALALPDAAVPAAPVPAISLPSAGAVTLTGLDAHDGSIVQEPDGTLVMVGTRYGCGFVWQWPSTPWCGFGAWTSTTGLGGQWTYRGLLFDPNSSSVAFHNESWQTVCGNGDGCFNPRLIKRPDGVWVLWFNAPGDLRRYGANEFWAMGCNGPTGPCGAGAGAPYGSTIKPSLWVCNTGGDFAVFPDPGDPTGATAYLVCGTSTWTVNVEKLQPWWADGTGVGASNLAGLSYVEGAGMFRAPDGTYVLTHGGNCPYCSGTDTSYVYAPSVLGPWTVPAGTARRREISGHSCGGQPRSVAVVDGHAYEWVDLWYDALNEANAGIHLEPLTVTGPYNRTPDGTVWPGPFTPFTCSPN